MIQRNDSMASMIVGVGSYLPEQVVTNDDLADMMDTSDEWIRTRTGVGLRRRAAPHETTASLAVEAASRAVIDAGLSGGDIDLIVMGTMFPDFTYPGPGMVVQRALCGDKPVPVIDIRVQCAGFIYALSMADLFIRSGQARRVLCVFAEKEFDHFKVDRQIGVIFGDGAGAAVIGPAQDGRGLVVTDLKGDGAGVPDLIMTSDNLVGLREGDAIWPAELSKARQYWQERGFIPGHTKYPFWIGQEVFRNAVKRLAKSVRDVLETAGCRTEDVDLFFLHQANARINGKIKEMLHLPDEKVPENIERIGNTGAASIIILMDETRRDGRLKPGDLCLLSAFGAGYLWGSALLRF
ncbi:MAG: beta-ketoacyl-ACP synthase 3 [Deltaproteobacteria bacterium]|nr:beta-ketoacyl-ACP synthase 3 [Deltaproteobacteria bacterium]